MAQQKPKARIYVTSDLTSGGTVSPDSDQAHYLSRVMRLVPGDGVVLFNGRHGEWWGTVQSIAKKSCSLSLDHQIRQQVDETDLWLAYAPLKKSRTDFLIEKSTELGASRLIAVFTDHTDTGRVNTDRLAQVATEAAEQCERLTIPEICGPLSFSELIATWPEDRLLLIADETGGGQPIAELAATLHKPDTPKPVAVGLMIGPEGGFSSSELDELKKLPFSVFIGLGPRILRAETAAIAALACIQSLIGDWHRLPRSG